MIKENRPLWRLLVIVVLVAALLSGCGNKDKKSNNSKPYTIGVLIQAESLAPVFDGFKARMTELGYTEGKNITYLYDGPTGTIDALKPAAEKLKSENPNMLLTVGNPPSLTAQEVFKGTQVPILFAPTTDPIGAGLIASFQAPGGQLTGISNTDTISKTLEWLLQIIPTVKTIYVPHIPSDSAAAQSFQSLSIAAQNVGITLLVSEASTPDDLSVVAKTIPDNADAVFLMRSAGLGAQATNMVQAANERGIPVVTANIGIPLEQGVMIGYGPGFFEMGQQAARLADQILKGTNPATVPVEAAQTYLGINLQTAQTIGIQIPDSIINQAEQIIRPAS